MNWFTTHFRADSALVLLHDEIGVGATASDFIASLQDKPEVHLRVDSPGGDARVAVQVYEELKKRRTTAVITGACGSSSQIITMAAQHIACQAHSRILVHAPANFVYGDAAELLFQCSQLQKLHDAWHRILCDRTHQPAETVQQWLGAESWFTAEEALLAGLVDQIEPTIPAPAMELVLQDGDSTPVISMSENEQAFRYWLSTFPKIETTDRAALLKTLNDFAMVKIVENQHGFTFNDANAFPNAPLRNAGRMAASTLPECLVSLPPL